VSRELVVKPGQRLYDSDGRGIGVVCGITGDGFEVSPTERVVGVDLEHDPGGAVGEGYLVWRCAECGEVGDLETVPGACPGCGAEREALYAWIED